MAAPRGATRCAAPINGRRRPFADVAGLVWRWWGEVDGDCRNGVQSLENEVLYATDETPADLMDLVKSQFVQAPACCRTASASPHTCVRTKDGIAGCTSATFAVQSKLGASHHAAMSACR